MARSLGVLVDQQARRSQLPHERREAVVRRPVLAMALQYGAGGEEVVTSLAKELALDVFDREIVRQIAESTHRSERVVSTLDHNVRRVDGRLAGEPREPRLPERDRVPPPARRGSSERSPTTAARSSSATERTWFSAKARPCACCWSPRWARASRR